MVIRGMVEGFILISPGQCPLLRLPEGKFQARSRWGGVGMGPTGLVTEAVNVPTVPLPALGSGSRSGII